MNVLHYPRLWAIDFHVHTSFSRDCATPPSMAIELARRKQLDGIAVTDHDTEEGGLAAVAANPYHDFLVIPGAEIKTDLGDVIGLFLTHPIKSRKLDIVLEEIAVQGGISIIPHPLRTFCSVNDFLVARERYPQVDAWEVLNGRYERMLLNESVEAFQRFAILNASAGSDAHLPWELGRCHTVMFGRPDTPHQFRKLLPTASSISNLPNDLWIAGGIHVARLIRDAKTGSYYRLMKAILSTPYRATSKAIRSAISRKAAING
jgi:predicted metal-dependent phosphoesterase TrpH